MSLLSDLGTKIGTLLKGKLDVDAKAADTDLFDGKNSSEFIYGNAVGTNQVTDFNAIAKSGFYDGYPADTAGNAFGTSGTWNWLVHHEHSNANGYGFQQAVLNGSTARMKLRTQSGNSWNSWAEVITTNNVGDYVSAGAGAGAIKSGMVRTEGGYSSTASATLSSLSVDLTGLTGKTLIVYGSSAISEPSNTANTGFLGILINNGSTSDRITGQRFGLGIYSNVTWNSNATVPVSVQGVYTITSAMATTCTIQMDGGINSGAFYFGDQPSYTYYDGYGFGTELSYVVI